MAYLKCLRNVSASTIPDGKTVTPTDDISIWLACGGRSETYTTLSQVLADSTCLNALINDNNAVDYLVRSTTWASDVCGDSGAMTAIGGNNYAANTLLADSTWCSAIANSAYRESVLNVKVPVMTSNTTPSGEVIFASNHVTGGQPYHVFDGDDATDYQDYGVAFSTTDSEKYVGYQFPSSVKIYCMDVLSYTISQAGNIRTCTLSAQYDDNGWQTDSTLSFSGSTSPTTYKHVFNAARNSQKFRIYTTGGNSINSSGYLRLGIVTLQFYGREDV